jgi:transcriptional regulator with XRE-family HTH domain
MDARFYGHALRICRKRKKLSLTQFAKKTGFHTNTLSALETRGQGMRIDLFIDLCAQMDVDPIEAADLAYFYFRKHLRVEAEKAMVSLKAEEESVIPSMEEIATLHQSATNANLKLLLGVLRRLQPDFAINSFILDRLREVNDEGAPPKRAARKRPSTAKRRRTA